MTAPLRVLVAEDHEDYRSLITDVLQEDGHEVIALRDGHELKLYVDDSLMFDHPRPRVHALVSDVRMPGMSGLELLRYLREMNSDIPTILLTAFGDSETRERAAESGAFTVLDKPVHLDVLRRTVREAIASREGRDD